MVFVCMGTSPGVEVVIAHQGMDRKSKRALNASKILPRRRAASSPRLSSSFSATSRVSLNFDKLLFESNFFFLFSASLERRARNVFVYALSSRRSHYLLRRRVMTLALFLLLQVTRVTRVSVAARALARKMTIRRARRTKRNEASFPRLRPTSSGRGCSSISR